MKAFNKKELNVLLKYWQRVLRLQDWNIQLIISPEWHEDGTWGTSVIYAGSKNGRITISNPANHQAYYISDYDGEETLVHELLHFSLDFLKKYNIKDDKTDSDLFEAHIELTAQALVKLHRDAT